MFEFPPPNFSFHGCLRVRRSLLLRCKYQVNQMKWEKKDHYGIQDSLFSAICFACSCLAGKNGGRGGSRMGAAKAVVSVPQGEWRIEAAIWINPGQSAKLSRILTYFGNACSCTKDAFIARVIASILHLLCLGERIVLPGRSQPPVKGVLRQVPSVAHPAGVRIPSPAAVPPWRDRRLANPPGASGRSSSPRPGRCAARTQVGNEAGGLAPGAPRRGRSGAQLPRTENRSARGTAR